MNLNADVGGRLLLEEEEYKEGKAEQSQARQSKGRKRRRNFILLLVFSEDPLPYSQISQGKNSI